MPMSDARLRGRENDSLIHEWGRNDLPKSARRYLERRAISKEWWELAGVRYFETRDTSKWFKQLATGLLFPYPNLDGNFDDGFGRIRILGAQSDRKFIQPAGTANRFYFAPLTGTRSWKDVSRDTKQAIHVAEGEVKSLALAQSGYAALGISGVWSWRTKAKEGDKTAPVPDFDLFHWSDRKVVLVFDCDVATKVEVQLALLQLGKHFESLGAHVSVVLIPDLGDGVSGVDDFIAKRGIDAFRELAEADLDDEAFANWGLRDEPELTDLGNARRFVGLHGDRVRFIHGIERWLLWDGFRWKEDETEHVLQLSLGLGRALMREAAETQDKARRHELSGWALQSEQVHRARSMLAAARGLEPIAATPAMLDTHKWYLGVQNGVIDLRSGKKVKARHDWLITKVAGAEFDKSAACPRWEQFLSQVMSGDDEMVSYLQRVAGYCLTGDVREDKLFFLHGRGGNGKTTFVNTLKAMLGDYARQLPTDSLMERSRSSTANSDIARLAGARAAFAVETTSGQRLAEGLVKALSGRDTISARYMYSDFFEFKPQFKLMISGNHLPDIRGDDPAIWRRIHLVPFEVMFEEAEQNKTLERQLTHELPGILRWSVAGARKWHEHGLQPPAKVERATADYRRDSDVLGRFLKELTKAKAGHRIAADLLYRRYAQWCRINNERHLSQGKFATALKERGVTSKRTEDGNFYRDIAFRGRAIRALEMQMRADGRRS